MVRMESRANAGSTLADVTDTGTELRQRWVAAGRAWTYLSRARVFVKTAYRAPQIATRKSWSQILNADVSPFSLKELNYYIFAIQLSTNVDKKT